MTNNYEWRKNRNLHAICLLDMVLNNRFEEPYNKFPGDGPIPLLSKPNVKSKLSKKFWLYSQYLESQNLLKSEENFSPYDNYNNNINDIDENNNNNNCNYNNMNNINNDMEKPNQKNFRMNFRRPKTSDVKLNNKNMNIMNNNNNFNRNYCNENKKLNNKKKNQNQHNQNDIDEINKLNEIILNLQYELNKQDFIINNQIKEKMRLIILKNIF